MNQQYISKTDFDELKQYIMSVEKKVDKLLSLIEGTSKQSIQNNKSPITSTKKISIKTSKNDTSTQSTAIKRGHAIINIYDDIILITGETYDRRELIKSWGGKWNVPHKGWSVSLDRLSEIEEASQKYFNTVQFTKNQVSLQNMTPITSNNSYQNVKNISIKQSKQVNKSKIIEPFHSNEYSDDDCQIDSDFD
jgi:hypothetical protein